MVTHGEYIRFYMVKRLCGKLHTTLLRRISLMVTHGEYIRFYMVKRLCVKLHTTLLWSLPRMVIHHAPNLAIRTLLFLQYTATYFVQWKSSEINEVE